MNQKYNPPPILLRRAASRSARGPARRRTPRKTSPVHRHGRGQPLPRRFGALEYHRLRSLTGRLARDWRSRQLCLARFDDEVVIERVPRPLDIGRRRRPGLMANIIADERMRDPELHVRLEVLVVARVDLRKLRLEARLENEEMDVRRPHVVTALCPQQIADRTIDRYWIACRLDAAEADMAVLVGGELAPQVHVGLRRILVFVKAFG